MSKLLTIAIPTYNRADSLDKQLAWLAQSIRGCESECEIFVSDNCSNDHTQSVIKKWQNQLKNINFKSTKNSENIGLIRNILCCLSSAETKYVWTIGDDDNIDDGSIAYVVNKLKSHDDLSLLFLNFSGRNQLTNQPVHPPTIVGNRWFDADCENGDRDGKAIFEHCFAKSIGAVSFLSASIYRTDLIKRALVIWPDTHNNWLSLAYLAGYCAANGQVIVTKDTYIECIIGVSYWQKEADSALLMQYKHIPEVIFKLGENGYSKEFCRRMISQNLKEVSWKVFLGGLRRWPVRSLKILVCFFASVCISGFEIGLINKLKLGDFVNFEKNYVNF
ncbi:glycosyltransferase [Chrysosporum bergii ANA360D]|uniref:Glycosyltransferase n=1 Tax=Chrysosporum bergii ANA360D TaxID=617107 RepID=A0AA43GU60_9CYAN|nr:glycosyltransferase [Chrysosporum bergii]MDH6061630.1 glycosyltransferase [Chrysosporum bergii ANA360D]